MKYDEESKSKIEADKLRQRFDIPKHKWFSNRYVLKNWRLE